jgi:hypothetical protein
MASTLLGQTWSSPIRRKVQYRGPLLAGIFGVLVSGQNDENKNYKSNSSRYSTIVKRSTQTMLLKSAQIHNIATGSGESSRIPTSLPSGKNFPTAPDEPFGPTRQAESQQPESKSIVHTRRESIFVRMYGKSPNRTQDQPQSILQKIKKRDTDNGQLQLCVGGDMDRKEQGRLGRTGVLAKRTFDLAHQRKRIGHTGRNSSEVEPTQSFDPVESRQHLSTSSSYESGIQYIPILESTGPENLEDVTEPQLGSDGHLRPNQRERSGLLQSLCSMGQSLHNVWSPPEPHTNPTTQVGSILQPGESGLRFATVVNQVCVNNFVDTPQSIVPLPTTFTPSSDSSEITTRDMLRHSDNTNMANQNMVVQSPEHTMATSTIFQVNTELDSDAGPTTRGNVKRLHGMELYEAVVRESLYMNDITAANARLLMTRKDTTMKTYVCAFMHLHKWCAYQSIEPLDMTPNHVVDYIMT